MKTFDLQFALTFLGELKTHNNKPWFDTHRDAYEKAKTNFESFIGEFIAEYRTIEDLGDLNAKDCTFRINRDIRFSKDKSPYKTNMAAQIARGGRKSGHLGYYIHLAPGNASFLAGGVYLPEPAVIGKFRQTIDRDASRFKRIVGNKEFVRYFGSVEGERLKTAPQGYARDHPEIELLKLKQVLASHPLSDKQILSADLVAHLMQACKALKPFLDYLNTVIR